MLFPPGIVIAAIINKDTLKPAALPPSHGRSIGNNSGMEFLLVFGGMIMLMSTFHFCKSYHCRQDAIYLSNTGSWLPHYPAPVTRANTVDTSSGQSIGLPFLSKYIDWPSVLSSNASSILSERPTSHHRGRVFLPLRLPTQVGVYNLEQHDVEQGGYITRAGKTMPC